MVSTVWIVDEHRLADFVEAMEGMRRIRMRTGAFRWSLYRDVVQPLQITEVFEIHTRDQHLQQHERLDAEAMDGIRYAASFDVTGNLDRSTGSCTGVMDPSVPGAPPRCCRAGPWPPVR